MTADSTKSISDLRETLFATIEGLRNGSVDLDKARAVNEVAKTIVDTAKVEVDYLRVTGGGDSEFIDTAVGTKNLPDGITGIRRHLMK